MNNTFNTTDNGDGQPLPDGVAETTGRYLVLLDEAAMDTGVSELSSATSGNIVKSSDMAGEEELIQAMDSNQTVVFEALGVAVVSAPYEPLQELAVSETSSIQAVEPERYVYVAPEMTLDYAEGYRDGVNELVEKMRSMMDEAVAPEDEDEGIGPEAWNESQFTWGLQAARVPWTAYSGKGVRVAILDTGFDFGHPDYAGRRIESVSFVPGESAQDGHGHGTHCTGTACGARRPRRNPRYGVAYDAGIYIAKVLSNAGRGTDSSILAGINWAVIKGCAVASMSLGAPTRLGQPYSQVFETVARRSLAAGTLIIAAAGNDSRRPGVVNPVSHPANCPSIMAVAALDERYLAASFSNGGLNPAGGEVNIAAPGVNVYSSTRRPTLYARWQGTSMATPHVAGIAALFAQANPGVRGQRLATLMYRAARRLRQSPRDVGVGLIQAP